MASSYLIDANVFVQAKNLHYRFDFCRGFWSWIEAGHVAGVLFSVDKVHAELVAGNKGDPARVWAESVTPGFFLEDAKDGNVMKHYSALMGWASSSGHYSTAAIAEFAAFKNADPFLISVAKEKGAVVVTHEKSDPLSKKRIPLPDAALAVGVQTITIFDLLSKHAASTFTFKP